MLANTQEQMPASSTSNSTIVRAESRFEILWIIGVLFVFSMFATYVFMTMPGPARLPAGLAAVVAPLVIHRVLARRR